MWRERKAWKEGGWRARHARKVDGEEGTQGRWMDRKAWKAT